MIKEQQNIIQEKDNQLRKQQKLQYNTAINTHSHLKLCNWMQNNKLQASDFKNLLFLGQGCNGLVMKSIVNFENNCYTVALKMIINIHSHQTVSHENKVKNEYTILPKLVQLHPNIVRKLGSFSSKPTQKMINHVDNSIKYLCYRGSGELKAAQFFVLEYYDKTLKSIIKDLSEDKIIKYICHLARGLLYLYECKVAHLDIKTDNLMISLRDELVIVDFGVAGIVRDDFTVDYRKTIGGNTYHLSPEVLNARNSENNLPCEKQYSWELGMIFYEMLSKGEYPFDTYANELPIIVPELILKDIPQKYHKIIQELLCNQDERLSIRDAWIYFEEIYSKMELII